MRKISVGDGTPEEPFVISYYQIGVTDKWESDPLDYYDGKYEFLSDAIETMEGLPEPDGEGEYLAIIGFLEDGTAVYVADEENL